ncbi:MAG: non-canonical purine NTP diphosphatase [Candidatus Saccharimonadaceae bacterium]
MKIVFATNNQHKLDEIRKISKGKLEVWSLADINCNEDIAETGNTLKENALIKARFVKDKFNIDCFADDTGLEVEALDNAPGIYSARYAGTKCDSEENMRKLLEKLKSKENRNARFRTVIALLIDGKEFFFEGEIKGEIIHTKQGTNGFGYDPIFKPHGYDKSFGELSEEIKNTLSHRAIATKKLVDFLLKQKEQL